MGFDRRDIRPGMDVFTYDNDFLGSVLSVRSGPDGSAGEQVTPGALQSSQSDGELRGPMPTQPTGNPGPATQSARSLYATAPDAAPSIGRGSIEVGKWWGLLGCWTIPVEDVHNVSLERVTLKRRRAEL